MTIFLNKNVVSFRTLVIDVTLKNLIIEIFIIILVLNLKQLNCILISNKEGYNNSHIKPINNYLVSNNSFKHLKNLNGNKEIDNLFNKNLICKNIKYNKIVHKVRDPNTYFFISNRCVTTSYNLNKKYKSSQLFTIFESKFDLKSKISDNDKNSSSYYPTHTIVSDSNPIPSLKYPRYEFKKILEENTDQIKDEKSNDLKNLHSLKKFTLSNLDIGLIKIVNCERVIDVKSVFNDIYPEDESDKRYRLYKDNLVRFLVNELRDGSFQRTIDLFYNNWKNMDNVALSRGFRVLFTELFLNKRFSRVVEAFIQILPNRFVIDTHSFLIASKSINRTYVDGWVISLVLISVMNSFGIEFLKRVSVFTDFKSSVNLDIFKDPKSWFIRHFGAKLHDSNYLRLLSSDLFYNTTIYSCFNSRNFSILLSLFYEKLVMYNAINSFLTVDYKPKLNEKEIENLNNIPHSDENKTPRSFDSILNSCLSLLSNTNVLYNSIINEKELHAIKTYNISKILDRDWSIYVILKHSLSNIFNTNEIVITNSVENSVNEDMNTNNNKNNNYRSNSRDSISNGNNEVMKDDNNKDMNGNSDNNRDNNNELEYEQMTKLRELLKSRSNLIHVNSDWTYRLYNLISEKNFFIKNEVNKYTNTLEKIIESIREYVSSGKDIGVSEVYGYMRMLLRFRISGSTAFDLLFMLIPNLTFAKWAHYHMFACCLEHDFEQGNLSSIDDLLQYMVKMGCKPEPGLYNRFFELCNSFDRPLTVLKHFKIITENKINWETWDRYAYQRKIRVSFGMYEQIFISCMKTGNIKYAMKALLHLLEAMKGTYKTIPDILWKTFIKTIESCEIDNKLKAILDQLSISSKNNPIDMTKQIFIKIPEHRSALINEIERILKNYINDNN